MFYWNAGASSETNVITETPEREPIGASMFMWTLIKPIIALWRVLLPSVRRANLSLETTSSFHVHEKLVRSAAMMDGGKEGFRLQINLSQYHERNVHKGVLYHGQGTLPLQTLQQE